MSTPLIAFDEIDSTNAEARRRADAGENGPVWFTAARQTAGRGRRGRAWETGQGNLAATLLITTDRPPADAAQLSFVAALAVCDFARAYLSADKVKVKWPNDVMVGADKVSGILLESGRRSDGRLWVAVGVGINLAHHPHDTERPATSFAAHMAGPSPDPALAMAGLASAFDDWLAVWARQPFAAIVDAWTARAYGLGQPATARLPSETVHGIAEGLDADGSLRLKAADGSIRRITAGDVFFGDA